MPPDAPFCTEITPDRGYCVWSVSGRDMEVNETNKLEGKTWWELRPTMIRMPISTWKAYKAFIIKTCKKNKKMCDKAISQWERTVHQIDGAVTNKEKSTKP